MKKLGMLAGLESVVGLGLIAMVFTAALVGGRVPEQVAAASPHPSATPYAQPPGVFATHIFGLPHLTPTPTPTRFPFIPILTTLATPTPIIVIIPRSTAIPTPTPSPTRTLGPIVVLSPEPAQQRALFYGQVTVEGVVPSVGTQVVASIGSTVCGVGSVGDLSADIPNFGIGYIVFVESTSAVPGCAALGATVSFAASGVPCQPTATWAVQIVRVDLTCASATPTPATTASPGATPTPTFPPGSTVLVAGQFNFVVARVAACVAPEQALATALTAISIVFRPVTTMDGGIQWLSFDPAAPPALNNLTQICPLDILSIFARAAAAIVWP